jgi:hypothetical protein
MGSSAVANLLDELSEEALDALRQGIASSLDEPGWRELATRELHDGQLVERIKHPRDSHSVLALTPRGRILQNALRERERDADA